MDPRISQVVSLMLSQATNHSPDELFDMVLDELDAQDIALTQADRTSIVDMIDRAVGIPFLLITAPITFDGFIVPEGRRFYDTQVTDAGWAVAYLGSTVLIPSPYGIMVLPTAI